MQKTSRGATSAADITYRERLTPSLWTLASAAVLAPMIAMVFVPFDKTLGFVIGGAVAVALITALILLAPRVRVQAGVLYAGRAHIPVHQLGRAEPVVGLDARQLRGPGLPRSAWHLIRGGIDDLVRVPVTDPDDPVTEWIVSSRTPDRMSAAIRRAQARAAGQG